MLHKYIFVILYNIPSRTGVNMSVETVKTLARKYENIVSSLLGRIIIVDDMEHASHIAKAYQYKYKIVTLEGEVFNSGGSLSGGSMKNQSNNMFTRARELKETQERIVTLKEEQITYQNEVAILTKVLEEVTCKLNDANNHWIRLTDEDKRFTFELEKNHHALKLTKENQLQLINERNNIDESINLFKKGNSLDAANETIYNIIDQYNTSNDFNSKLNSFNQVANILNSDSSIIPIISVPTAYIWYNEYSGVSFNKTDNTIYFIDIYRN